ncbi:unnamed protein product [Rotaria sp. Silwood2]|nr:unnamed protein product [Rotaria sp. Silwood2]CAF4154979.1 unnamed protein product [Rotaria sp. Silwood2]
MEFLLANLLHLKHLELHAKDLSDLVDGYRWQILTSNLLSFKFKFKIDLISIEQNFASFRTSFWLQEKHWYVAYDDEYLFSVPHFAPVNANTPYSLPTYYTTPNDNIFRETITKLTLSILPKSSNYHFPNVETLEISCVGPYYILFEIIDLSRVQHLIITWAEYILHLKLMLKTMSSLNRLTIKSAVTFEHLIQMHVCRFQQIRRLQIQSISIENNHNFEELFTCFPYVEHLHIQRVSTRTNLTYLIDGFKHLLNASFGIPFIVELDDEDIKNLLRQPHILLFGSKRLACSTFTCNVYPFSDWTIAVWIGERILCNSAKSSRKSIFRWLRRHGCVFKCLTGHTDENTSN